MRTTLTLLGAVSVFPALALAQPIGPPAPAEMTGASAGERMTMPAKRLALRTHLEINLSDGSAFEPVSVAPDAWYGINDDLTIGVVHSAAAASGVMGGVGSSLCLTGTSGGCADVYRGLGVDARYHLRQGKIALAANGGLYINRLDPFQLAIKLGAIARWRPSPSSKLAIDAAPNLFIGLTERDATATQPGNTEVLSLPISAVYDLRPKLSLAAQTGLVLPFTDTADRFAIPLSLGVGYQLSYRISLDAAFSLPALIGGDAVANGFDARTITLGGGYAF